MILWVKFSLDYGHLIILQHFNMDAFFLIDKPLDYSSFDVIRVLRKKTQEKKMGHT
jgi:tRNA U55 pseudouridine synthase TruB